MILSFFFALFLQTHAEAKKLTTSYLTAEVPASIKCNSFKKLVLCKNYDKDPSDIILLVHSKLKGPTDNEQEYESFLKSARKIKSQTGKYYSNKIEYIKKRNIQDQPWIESLQFNSELPNFYTYYLFTISKNTAISTQVSVHKSSLKTYEKDIQTYINSLQLRGLKIIAKSPDSNASEAQATGDMKNESKARPSNKIFGLSKKKAISLGIILISLILIFISFKK